MNRSTVARYTLMLVGCFILAIEARYYIAFEGKPKDIVMYVIILAWILMYGTLNAQFPWKPGPRYPNNNTPAI